MNALSATVLFLCTAAASAQQGITHACGDLANAYGPLDYRRERDGALRIVDGAHFTREVEMLIRGNAGHLGGDLDYTLRASPNHHRALMALSKFALREKTNQPPHTRYTVDCYFDRGIRFQPDDVLVRMIYANYLKQTNRHNDARVQLEFAGRLAGDNPVTHYNIGLLYFELRDLDNALVHALKAREYGNPRTELLDNLRAAGKSAAVDEAVSRN